MSSYKIWEICGIMKKFKVLVCDDSKLIRLKMKQTLNDIALDGYEMEVFEAADGQQGIDIYKQKIPHVMFVDMVMPVKTGLEAIVEIMAFDPKAKIVMASSVGTKENLKKALESGAYDFIQKPVDGAKVSNMIKRVLGK